VLFGDLPDDGQAQAAAFRVLFPVDAVEALEHLFPLLRRDARAGVVHLQHGRPVPGEGAHRDAAAGRRV